MATWNVLLLPPAGSQRARARWLCPSGCFSLDLRKAWAVADPDACRARIIHWLTVKGRDLEWIGRMRLVETRPGDAPCSDVAEHCLQNASRPGMALWL
jgi:hypothetical protein